MTDEQRVDSLLRASAWMSDYVRWAVRFRLAPGPFRRLLKLPLMVLAKLMQFHLLLLKK
jgi:hypothetical protein